MRQFLMVAMAAGLTGAALRVDAQNVESKEGTASLITFDFGDGSKDTVLVLVGDVAESIYQKMGSVAETGYINTCTPTGQSGPIHVTVLKKIGDTFSCEQWPATCWGKPHYKCEASFADGTGKATPRYIRR